ncbi:MAG: carbon storage regulator CsrA [Oscillospiraceae bacterium]|nr:carbon storage regulator CsrA [Oscillospiraceae bacterium]
MLILSRKVGETLYINDDIEIKIVEVSGDKVRLGIEAPKDVKVLRSELRLTMESNMKAADAISPDAFKNKLNSLKNNED